MAVSQGPHKSPPISFKMSLEDNRMEAYWKGKQKGWGGRKYQDACV